MAFPRSGLSLVLLAILFSAVSNGRRSASASDAMNVLMIAVDDLRPVLGCYGDAIAITPNIDRLAARGVTFNHAYCQLAVCSPSRLSLLTGRRPDSIHVWDLATHFRETIPDIVTLPQLFKQNGYHTQSLGKVFHGSGAPSKDPPSWSAPAQFDFVRDPKLRYALPRNLKGKGLKRSAAEAADVDDGYYVDGVVCRAAIELLPELKSKDRPFFLAVGFRKPHLPFCAPRKYWDLYERSKISLPESSEHPVDAPEWATRSWRELEGYSDIPKNGELSDGKVRELRHGYYACVSYVDALIGRVLDALEQNGLTENTIIALWGDHGFHLGEQGLWTKANNYELACRVPLIIVDPRDTHPGQLRRGAEQGRNLRASQSHVNERSVTRGQISDSLVELVDLYPTLAHACGLPVPDGLEGTDLMPLMVDPDRPWKKAVFSQYPRMLEGHRHRGRGEVMGYAVRTKRFRYVEWKSWESGNVIARELYDHQVDPGESRNIAALPSGARHVGKMSKLLQEGWRAAAPAESEE